MADGERSREGFVREITDPDEDYSRWYQDTVTKADLADYGPVKGSMVMKPYGYAIWEAIQGGLDRRFRETGHGNAYFPLLIPESLLMKESEHVEGFAPEVAWVTQGGQEALSERLAIRPTSEAIIMTMYAKWVESYRDLPLLINQWCNVLRWEKVTRPFLRGAEFLWQEGHTAHATGAEAEEETMRMLDVYEEFLRTELAIPSVKGRKSESEKFPGAVATYSVEAMMGDNRALQSGTSHYFGTRFAEAFGIRYLDRDGELKLASTTSWGMSFRVIGALIMVHGDERGLVLPPRVAPTEVVIVPIASGESAQDVLAEARRLASELSGAHRVRLDDRAEFTPGWKYNEWEMRGVPLRIEIGPRDLKEKKAVLVRRDDRTKAPVPLGDIARAVEATLSEIQANLLRKASASLAERTFRVTRRSEMDDVLTERRGFVRGGWCGEAACEREVKEATGGTIRNLPLDQHDVSTCVACGKRATAEAVWGRAY